MNEELIPALEGIRKEIERVAKALEYFNKNVVREEYGDHDGAVRTSQS